MSMAYAERGRSRQKSRTLQALLAAARELVAAGQAPTVDEVAARAQVSRTTAYRYFPNQRALLVAAHPESVATSMLPEAAPSDPAARLDAVLGAFTEMLLQTEAQQRTMLRLSLAERPEDRGPLPLRQGRAIRWLHEALAPLEEQLGAQQLHALVLAIRSATGIESLVWLTDVAGLGRDDAVRLMRWTARSLLRAALDGDPPPN